MQFFYQITPSERNDETCKILRVKDSAEYYQGHLNSANTYMRKISLLLKKFNITTWKRNVGRQRHFPVEEYIEEDFNPEKKENILIEFKNLRLEKYTEFEELYTDGSRVNSPVNSTASGLYIKNKRIDQCWKLAPTHTVMAAELYAIDQALLYVEKRKNEEKCNVCRFKSSCSIADITSRFILPISRKYLRKVGKNK